MEVKGTLKYSKVQRTPQTGENAGILGHKQIQAINVMKLKIT